MVMCIVIAVIEYAIQVILNIMGVCLRFVSTVFQAKHSARFYDHSEYLIASHEVESRFTV